MTAPGQQELDLMKRTEFNLRYIEARWTASGPYEITQLINSFLGMLAHPREHLFRDAGLRSLKVDDPEFAKLGFPNFDSSWEGDTEKPENLFDLLRLLRNGIAHGNLDLLTPTELRHRTSVKEPDPNLAANDIAGIEIWNREPRGRKRRTWGTILTIEDMRCCLNAMMRLADNPALRRTRALKRDGGRTDGRTLEQEDARFEPTG